MKLSSIPASRATVRWPKRLLTPSQLADLRDSLTFRNSAFFSARQRGLPTMGMPDTLVAFEEDEHYLYLPRHTEWQGFQLPNPRPRIQPKAYVPVSFCGALRPDQEEAVAALSEYLFHRMDGILSLPCGRGKTVVALHGWTQLEQPGLAVVPTLQLAEQWKERILQFTDLQESDIGMVGGGHLTHEKPFVISTIHSLAKRRLPPEFYSRFGVVFFDEVHRLGAPYFSQVASKIDAVRIGLSATWRRNDGMEALFQLHVGDVFYEDRERQLTPEVWFLETPARINLSRYRMWRSSRGELNFARIITALSRDPARTMHTLNIIEEAFTDNRKILVLGDRKEQLFSMGETLASRVGAENVGLCVGSLNGRTMQQEQRQTALTRGIILATSQLVKEGLDQADIDTVLILNPQSNSTFSEQASGRILRAHRNKKAPVVLVLWDRHCTATHMGQLTAPYTSICRKMESVFRRLGYVIRSSVQ